MMTIKEMNEGLSNFIPYLALLSILLAVLAAGMSILNHNRFIKANKVLVFIIVVILAYFSIIKRG